jgi:hypothetical protein
MSWTYRIMGWTFCSEPSKFKLMAKILAPRAGKKILNHVRVGNNLWVLEERDKDPTIVYYQIAQEENVWGFQEWEEGTAPVNCPLFLLDLAPPIDHNWRQRVRHYHADHNKHPQPKEVWSLKNRTIPQVTITEIRRRTIVGTYLGHKYRGPITDLGKRLRSWGVPASVGHH